MLMRFWNFITAWPRAFMAWVHAAFCALMDPEGRRAWAVVIAFGCGVTMTGYAIAAMFLVRTHAMLVFWLGAAAMFIILVTLTAFTGLLVKREIGGSVTKDSANFSIKDTGGSDGPSAG